MRLILPPRVVLYYRLFVVSAPPPPLPRLLNLQKQPPGVVGKIRCKRESSSVGYCPQVQRRRRGNCVVGDRCSGRYSRGYIICMLRGTPAYGTVCILRCSCSTWAVPAFNHRYCYGGWGCLDVWRRGTVISKTFFSTNKQEEEKRARGFACTHRHAWSFVF